jgi:thiosulfate dehydrogenase
MLFTVRNVIAAIAILACAVACSAARAAGTAPASPAPFDPQALPAGPLGDSIRYGRSIVEDTQHVMQGNVRARMSCAACHVGAGTVARGGSFIGLYGRFPQWNARSHRVISLHDRITECFLRSMNGKPPDYASKEMIAVVAYIAWLSRDIPVGTPQDPKDRFIEPVPERSPDVANGGKIYATKCAACHGADGNGSGDAIPPLWGAQSFNDGAGMARIDRMTGFVHYNMPQNAPGSLSKDDAYDVSAFVLTHTRPKLDLSQLVTSSPDPAAYY